MQHLTKKNILRVVLGLIVLYAVLIVLKTSYYAFTSPIAENSVVSIDNTETNQLAASAAVLKDSSKGSAPIEFVPKQIPQTSTDPSKKGLISWIVNVFTGGGRWVPVLRWGTPAQFGASQRSNGGIFGGIIFNSRF